MNQHYRNDIVFYLFIAFLASWVLSEAIDIWQRQTRLSEMQSFMQAGARFTAEDGYRLCKRIQHLELQHHTQTTIEECKLPSDYNKSHPEK